MAYQRIITSASAQYPLAAWLNYDIQFRTLAASDPSLRRDTRHTDLWLQCVTAASTSAIRWPCSHCGATNHYPRNCSFCFQPMGKDQLPPQPPIMGNSQSQEDYPTSNRLPATPIIAPPVAARTAYSSTNASTDHSAKYCPNRGSTAQ